ncbi:Microtubules assembly and stabilization protein [Sporothrix stenoceras]|uniref:Microtubules assembly and stabilization protein n=1 Tax=Sporothrix stenoceras TaxID=5173 RepID=A0ABR3ZHC2_9PEZI
MNSTMEHIHGIDVSWMTHGAPKDGNTPKPTSRRRNTLQSQSAPPPQSPVSPSAGSPAASSPRATPSASPVPIPIANAAGASPTQQLSSSLPAPSSSPRGRRPSWFSNISSKFSTNPGSSPPQATNTTPKQAELSVPRANIAKNAVLQHAAKYEGEGPYTPAPPKSSGQAGLLHVLRRLSTSGGNTGPAVKGNHGLVERRVLNVDRNRERCRLQELNQAKLRRVAFCVDVEIAPMPKYLDQDQVAKQATASVGPVPADKSQKKKTIEKSEGDALKNAKALLPEDPNQPKPTVNAASSLVVAATEASNPVVSSAKPVPVSANAVPSPQNIPPQVPPKKDANGTASPKSSSSPPASTSGDAQTDGAASDPNRKKEKKKRSEEERKMRKERKRRQAEANGMIPMEIYLDSDDSDTTGGRKSTPSTVPTTPRTQLAPTTNPVRIYRRCCQLRETPILKKVTEQLADPAVFSSEHGVVSKLDLTGYWLQLADLVTLGDFLAVVPIREVILENCGLNDEGLRVILAGLLAARKPQKKHIHLHHFHRHLHSNSSATHMGQTVPVTAALPHGEVHQGGFVERLVLKNNKIGVEGWKHVCLFIYMCRSLKAFDLSNVVFPHVLVNSKASHSSQTPDAKSAAQQAPAKQQFDVCQLLSQSIGERLGGSTLELLNFGDTGLSSEQLGWIVDGIIQSGTKRLGLAHNDLDDAGVQHIARYLASGRCEGLDLGGNDLRDRLEVLADAAVTNNSLWALSLADCNLTPASLCKLLPKLVELSNFRFLDLSHNHELFEIRPSATILLRRYLPMMESLKRLHLSDVAMTSEQAIAIAEVLPEVKELAHLNILQNPELTKLADARTEESQEQACALYASFLAATRLSKSIVAVDMPVPTNESSEIVRAMAKQVLAYCLRNVDRVTLGNPAALVVLGNAKSVPPTTDLPEVVSSDSTSSKTSLSKGDADYPDVLQHLVGHDATIIDVDDDIEAAPDDDYVIGGTGVAQALECCLKNRGPELTEGPPGANVVHDGDGALVEAAGASLPGPGKAKDMSKHLLQSARKIRLRLQPALQKARSMSAVDNQAYQRLLFLDNTLDGIIKRFEDEFPETRVSIDSGVSLSQPTADAKNGNRPHASSMDSGSADADVEGEGDTAAVFLSDGEDETDILPSRLSRSNSIMSLSSKGLTNEEGRMLRAGHRFRSGWFKHYNLLSGVDEIGSDPQHNHVLYELINEINDANINKKLAEKGIVRLFKEDREEMLQILKEQDPEHWDRFIESQEKARANKMIELGNPNPNGGSGNNNSVNGLSSSALSNALMAAAAENNESAILDD